MAGYRPATETEIIEFCKKQGIQYDPNANYGIRIYDPNYTEPEKKPLSLEEQAQFIIEELAKGTPRVRICSMLGLTNINVIEDVLQKAEESRKQRIENLETTMSPKTPPSNADIETMQEQINFLMQNMQLLQKTLDNERKANIEFKKQLDTLQGKGANMAETIEIKDAGQQWEYKRISTSTSDKELNELGQEKWELVATAVGSNSCGDLILKRPKQKNKESDYGYGR